LYFILTILAHLVVVGRYCACEILIANPIDWLYAACLEYFIFFSIDSSEARKQYDEFDKVQGLIQDFKLGGGALKKIAPSGGRRENVWSISCEKSRIYDKKSYFFQLRREARKFLGYFVLSYICKGQGSSEDNLWVYMGFNNFPRPTFKVTTLCQVFKYLQLHSAFTLPEYDRSRFVLVSEIQWLLYIA
jgi:hypothetical protein